MSKTYSTTIEITEEKEYSVTINTGLNLSAWIAAGSTTDHPLNPSSYANFAALEADEKAIRQLMLVHNAVDYLATAKAGDSLMQSVINSNICAKWINLSDYAMDKLSANSDIKSVMDTADKYGYGEWGLVGKVPVMTSNTAPSGTVIRSSAFTFNGVTYEAFRAFNSSYSDANGWNSNSEAHPWIGYTFPTPVVITAVKQRSYTSGQYSIGEYKIQGSNDGFANDVHDIYTSANTAVDTEKYDKFVNTTPYTSYRIYTLNNISGSGNRVIVNDLQFLAYEPLGNVPIMTANNAPYGVASASHVYSDSYAAWKMFDGNNTSGWSGNNTSSTEWVQYEFVNPTIINMMKIRPMVSGSKLQIKDYNIQGSNDGTNFTTIYTGSFENDPSLASIDNFIHFTNNSAYKIYRINLTTTWSLTSNRWNYGINTLQFYGRELKPLVPTMTSNTTPKGEVISSHGVYSSYAPWKAFDSDTSTAYYPYNKTYTAEDSYIGYDFKSQYSIKIAKILMHHDSFPDYPAKIQYYDEGTNKWIDCSDEFTVLQAETNYAIVLNRSVNTRKIRLYFQYTRSATQELQFYGMDYSEKEFAQGSTRKTIYDHGVELVTVQSKTIGSGAVATKEANQLYTYISTTANSLSVWLSGQDVSGYNYLCGKIGNKAQESAYIVVYDNIPSSFAYGSAYQSLLNGLTAMLDISQYTGTKYVGLYVGHANAGTVQFATIKELWLE